MAARPAAVANKAALQSLVPSVWPLASRDVAKPPSNTTPPHADSNGTRMSKGVVDVIVLLLSAGRAADALAGTAIGAAGLAICCCRGLGSEKENERIRVTEFRRGSEPAISRRERKLATEKA